jgi:UDP-glucose 4-epimerase
MSILITGGAGYIGSATASLLLDYPLVIIDNLCNSSEHNINHLYSIHKNVIFHYGDITNIDFLKSIFELYPIVLVIHFASLKSVPQSILNPLEYYQNNLCGTINLLKVMKSYHCHKMIFSSSACVYTSGTPPFKENSSTDLCSITNPYGKTKLMIEEVLKDVSKAYEFQVICLRYFNPVGIIKGFKNECKEISNLMDVILKKDSFTVYGDEYPTEDGTCIRDFIHIHDLASGHLQAVQKIWFDQKSSFEVINLGTGKGTSVLKLIQTFERVNQKNLNYFFGEPRSGDVAVSIAEVSKAKDVLGWTAQKTTEDMCKDNE